MKICRLAPIAIACLALLMPRLGFTEDTVGGAIKQVKPDCDSQAKNVPCAGKNTNCPTTNLVTVEQTSNQAIRHFYMGTTVQDCASEALPEWKCVGKANNAVACDP